jgi:peptidoglycan/LPS O-acetylase OafA/YrhL
MVLVFHGMLSQQHPTPVTGFFGSVIYAVIEHGWLGVDLFFVLSGFLITGILLDSKSSGTYFRDFWVRRALRILPLVLMVLGIAGLAYRADPLYFLMALFFSVDFAPQFGVIGPVGLGPMWSLAVEEQFYLLWPFLVLWLPRRALIFVAAAIVLSEPIIRILLHGGFWEVPWCRSDGLAIGALAAICVRLPVDVFARLRPISVGIIAALGLALIDWLFHSERMSEALRISEADVLFAVFVLAAYRHSGAWILAPLRSRVAGFIAATSFCAYLVHALLIDEFDAHFPPNDTAIDWHAAAIRTVAVIIVSFIIAAISRRYLELPFMSMRQQSLLADARERIGTLGANGAKSTSAP